MASKAIVFCVDRDETARAWLDYALKSLRSTFGRDEVDVFILAENCTDFGHGTKTVDVSPLIRDTGLSITSYRMWHGRYATPMMMMRLFIPYVEELKPYYRICYMDIDTEIVSKDFLSIFDVEMGEFDDVCAVMDSVNDYSRRERYAKRCRKYLYHNGIVSPFRRCYNRLERCEYFNSGVLLMNAGFLRVHFGIGEIADFCKKAVMFNESKFFDQDVMNAVYNIRPIPSRFNTFHESHVKGEPVYCLHHVGIEKISRYPVLSKEMFS